MKSFISMFLLYNMYEVLYFHVLLSWMGVGGDGDLFLFFFHFFF